MFAGKDSVSWEELPLDVRKHDYPYYFIGDLDCYPFDVEKQKAQNKCPEFCVRSHCIGCPIYEKQKEQRSKDVENVDNLHQYLYGEQKPTDADYISGIREELLGIEDNAKTIDGLTESQWAAIRAVHRPLGESIEKEQKPAEWSDTDNIGWDEAFACVARAEKSAKNEDELQNVVTAENWLKRIKSKYYVHPIKQEWSEEDEKTMQDLIDLLWIIQGSSNIKPGTASKYTQWLKSLRPSWKPSEEQMEALEWVVDAYMDRQTGSMESWKKAGALKELLEQLKAL